MVDIRQIKKFVLDHRDETSIVRRVLLAEPDVMSAPEYLAKLGTWFALLREETPEE